MSDRHRDHIAVPLEAWDDYFAGALDDDAAERLESLLMSCDGCAADAERASAVAGGLTQIIPPVITGDQLAALQAAHAVNVNPMAPGEHRRAGFPDDGYLLVHRFGGMNLGAVERVDVLLCDTQGNLLLRLDDVPFDRDAGEVLVACQRHFQTAYPAECSFTIEAWRARDVAEVATFRITHIF